LDEGQSVARRVERGCLCWSVIKLANSWISEAVPNFISWPATVIGLGAGCHNRDDIKIDSRAR
jgi:hypothetical protein